MLNQLDRTFTALADPGRRAMLSRLEQGPASVSELAAPLDMTLSAALQHVSYLEDTGLVTSHKEGRSRIVTANPASLRDARTWIEEHEAAWHRRFDRLGAVLDATHNPPSGPAKEN